MEKRKVKIIGSIIALALVMAGIFLYAKSPHSNSVNNAKEDKLTKTQTKETLLPGMKLYAHENPAFQLQYLESFKVSNFSEGNGEKIIFDGGTKEQWFQIFISLYDEPGPITPDRIKKDLPDLTIDAPQTVLIGGEQALVFFGRDESIGKTREVWIVHKGHLYQIVAYAAFDEMLSRLMTTWKFE